MEKKGLAKSIEPFFEKVEKLSKVQRVLISVGFFTLLAGVFIYFLFWPKLEKIQTLTADLKKLEDKLKTAKRNAADLKKFQTKMKEAEAQFNMAMKKLPEKEEIPSLLASISGSGQHVGMDFLLFEPKPEKPKEFYAEIPVAMSVKGDYHNLTAFFDQVARLSRIVNIRDIQIGRSKTKEAKELSTKCTAVTYKFIETPPKKKSKSKKK
ncbi:MAG: type 4a pilus biogenesis protein PilO [Desulfobacteraceae bacterium]|jgi:type IV pilus assembly protein PilO|nr:type 4a pilus biogenesis protein PilO [Desulfobacteraceae bacterium]